MSRFIPRRSEHGWQFRDEKDGITTHYVCLITGYQTEIIRPILSAIFCKLAGHTYGSYSKCSVCGKILY